MTRTDRNKLSFICIAILAVAASVSTPAEALDAAKDRRGLFWGMGFGGGGAVAVPANDMGGHVLIDLQLGAGVSKHLTLGFDTDVVIMLFDAQKNFLFTPGPELNWFIGDTGFFLRAGLGAAMSIVKVGNDEDFTIGFDAGVGFGWEFFANTNLALGLALEADYVVREGQDLTMFGFMFDLKYY